MKRLVTIFFFLTVVPLLSQEQETTHKFAHILKHLDKDGSSLSLSDDTEVIETVAKVVDHLYGPTMRMSEIMKDFDVPKIFENLGLSGVAASGYSSKKTPHFISNKLFFETSNSDKGIFSILEKPRPFTGHDFAPASTDILIETQINLAKFPQFITRLVTQVNTPVGENLKVDLATQFPEFDVSLGEFIQSLNARCCLAVNVDFNGGDVSKQPVFDATLKIDSVANKLWKTVEPQSEELGIKSEGRVHTFTLKDAFPNPSDPKKHVNVTFLFDLNADQIWISISPKHLTECRDPKAKKLVDDSGFKLITDDLPTKGCTQVYFKKEFTHELLQLFVNALGFAHNAENPNPTVKGMIDLYQRIANTFKDGNGVAVRLTKTERGVFIQTNAPFRVRSSGVLATIIGGINAFKFMQ